MSASPIVRVASVVGGLIFLALALKMGVESLHARATGSSMSNWKGGTMGYEDGFKLTAVFAVFAAFWFYFATRSKKEPNQPSEPTSGTGP
jgi:hypothetical protein